LSDFSAANVPFDSYGVGTKMGMSADAPWTDISYKLVEYHGRPVLKRSTGKISWPGKKQVFRWRDGTGQFVRDVIAQRDENLGGEVLLKEFMREGKSYGHYPSLLESRKVFAADFAALPADVKAIRDPARYPVEFSAKLNALRQEIFRKLEG
jgi:nicotinate phosphoribosyltransferase